MPAWKALKLGRLLDLVPNTAYVRQLGGRLIVGLKPTLTSYLALYNRSNVFLVLHNSDFALIYGTGCCIVSIFVVQYVFSDLRKLVKNQHLCFFSISYHLMTFILNVYEIKISEYPWTKKVLIIAQSWHHHQSSNVSLLTL